MAGWLIANGSASSVTEAWPDASRARIARRVGSASAANVASRLAVFITDRLYKGGRVGRQAPPIHLPTRLAPSRAADPQDDRLHLHAVTARRDPAVSRVLAPQRELQPLHPVEPRAVTAPAPPRRRPPPVVPLPWEPLPEQQPAAERESGARQRTRAHDAAL